MKLIQNMGILERFRLSEGTNKGVDNTHTRPNIEKNDQEAIKLMLNPTPELVPNGVDIKLQPWEIPTDIRAVALNIKEWSEGDIRNPHAMYEVAVMPPEYDANWVKDQKYAANPDAIWTGDGHISKRSEEIIHAKIKCADDATNGSPDQTMRDYYEHQRYFVTVNGGKVLPRASVYHFANGQVQALICQYNKEARPQHYEEVIDGNVVNTVDNNFDDQGNIRTTTESNFDGKGKLIGKYQARITYKLGDGTPWHMEAEWFKADSVSGQLVPQGNRQIQAKTYEELQISADLRVKALAMPNPVNQTTKVSRPGYRI